MFAYLIIFIYYMFICFMLFYFLKNKNFYQRRSAGSSYIAKRILNKLTSKVNSLSSKIGSVLISKKFFKVENKNVDLLKLQEAGSKTYITIESFMGYKVILLFVFFIGGCFTGISNVNNFVPGIISGAVGYFIPDIILLRFSSKRRKEIERDLPDIIDLLAVATLSGQNIYNAIKIVVSKYRGSISSELSNFIKDIDTGTGKFQAYKNLIYRSNSYEFRNFIFLLMQAERYGSSINDILKRKSDYMKFESYQNLEKEIRKKAVLILFPLVFLIMPSFIILVGGPLVYSIGGNLLNF